MKINPAQLKKAAELAVVPRYDDLDKCEIVEEGTFSGVISLTLVTYNQHDGRYTQAWLIDRSGNAAQVKSYSGV